MALLGTKRKKTKTAQNKRRKGFLSVALPMVKRFGVAVGVFVFVCWMGAWIYFTDGHKKAADWVENQMLMASASAGFKIENIYMEGREYSDASVILALMNVQKGDPLFSVQPKAAQELLTQIEWVDAAHVERRLPDTLFIRLDERQPIAFWQKNKKLRLLDQYGEIIHDESRNAKFSDLVIVIGEEAPQKTPELLSFIHPYPELEKRLEAATLMSNRRWDLGLSNDLVVKLPEDGVEDALQLLSKAQEEDGLLDKDLRHIDLREQGRIIIRTKPGGVEEYKASFQGRNNI